MNHIGPTDCGETSIAVFKMGEQLAAKDATIRDLEAALAAAREANGKMAEAGQRVVKAFDTRGDMAIAITQLEEALAHRLATKEKDNAG